MNPAALIEQAGVTVADGFWGDVHNFSDFVVTHLQPISQAEKIFFGVGQSAQDIEQLAILDIFQTVGVVKIIFIVAAHQLDAFIYDTFAIDVGFPPIIRNNIPSDSVNPR